MTNKYNSITPEKLRHGSDVYRCTMPWVCNDVKGIRIVAVSGFAAEPSREDQMLDAWNDYDFTLQRMRKEEVRSLSRSNNPLRIHYGLITQELGFVSLTDSSSVDKQK